MKKYITKINFLFIFILFFSTSAYGGTKASIAYAHFTDGYWQIWTMDHSGKGNRQLTFSELDKREPAWVNDHKIIYRTSMGKCFVVNLKTLKEQPVLENYQPLYQPYFSTSRDQVFFIRPDPVRRPMNQIWSASLDGQNGQLWLKDQELIMFPMTVAQTDTLIYTHGDEHGANHHIWTMDLGNKHRQQLTAQDGFDLRPQFLTAENKIIFSSNRYSQDYDLYTLDLQSQQVFPLEISPGFDGKPALSSNQEMIAFVSNRSGHQEIWRINTDGSGLRQLTSGDNESVDPAFN